MTFQMIKANTSVIQIQDVMLVRNPEFDLTKMEIYDFSDLVDILGSESLKKARENVGRKGIARKKPLDADVVLKQAHDNHSGKPACCADDGPGLCRNNQHYSTPVLRGNPKGFLTKCDVQLIIDQLVTTMGAEGYRSALIKMGKPEESIGTAC